MMITQWLMLMISQLIIQHAKFKRNLKNISKAIKRKRHNRKFQQASRERSATQSSFSRYFSKENSNE